MLIFCLFVCLFVCLLYLNAYLLIYKKTLKCFVNYRLGLSSFLSTLDNFFCIGHRAAPDLFVCVCVCVCVGLSTSLYKTNLFVLILIYDVVFIKCKMVSSAYF